MSAASPVSTTSQQPMPVRAITRAAARIASAPGALLTLVVLLVPVIPLAIAAKLVLDAGAGGAIQELLVKSAAGRTELFQPPGADDQAHLAVLSVIGVFLLAVLFAAVAITSFTLQKRTRTGQRLLRALQVWPVITLGMIVWTTVIAGLVAGVLLGATLLESVQFQLPTVVSALGVLLILELLLRTAPWVAISLTDRVGFVRAIRASWSRTRAQRAETRAVAAITLTGTALVSVACAALLRRVLSRAEALGLIGPTPVTIDIIAGSLLVIALLWALLVLFGAASSTALANTEDVAGTEER